jgi:hypothetical protein
VLRADVGVDVTTCLLALSLPPAAQSLPQSHLLNTSLTGLCGHSLLRWQVQPHWQHTGHLFLLLLVGLDHININAVGTSLTGTSSWPSHSTWRPTSTDMS